jgi:hypothetical protein
VRIGDWRLQRTNKQLAIQSAGDVLRSDMGYDVHIRDLGCQALGFEHA